MANNGLKPYTKQITGSIGEVASYSVNVHPDDANMHLMIPLIQSMGINPISLDLIYNYQYSKGTFDFGKGVNTNYEISITDDETHITVTNADGSRDEFTYDDLKGCYVSNTTTNTLKKNITLVDGDSDIITYELIDKQGNIMKYESDIYHPDEIIFKNGFVTHVYGTTISNDNGAKISCTRSNGLITKVIYTQDGIYQDQKVDITYDSNNNLSTIKKYICGNLVSSISFEFTDTIIIVTDELSKHSIKFRFIDSRVTYISEKYNLNYQLLYTIEYYSNSAKVIDSKEDYFAVVFDNNHFPVYEYDNNCNCVKTDYDSSTYSIKSKSKPINFKQMVKNSLIPDTDYNNTFTKTGNILIEKATGTITVMNRLAKNRYLISKSGAIYYKKTINGLAGDIISMAMFGKYLGSNWFFAKPNVSITIRTYREGLSKDYKSFIFSDVFETHYDLLTGSLTTTEAYDSVEFYMCLNSDIKIEISDILLFKKEFGTMFTYDKYQNLTDIVNGNTSDNYSYNTDNLLEESLNQQSELNKYYYDEKMNLVKIKSAYNTEACNTYDDNNQLIFQRTEGANSIIVTENEYDSYGNLIKTIDSLNNVVNYKYDQYNFYKLKKVSSAISVTEYDYKNDGLLEILKITDAESSDSSNLVYTYENRKIKTVTASNESKYQFNYDDRDNVIEVYLNSTLIYKFTYDEKDQIVEMRYSNNNDYYQFNYTNGLLVSICYVSGDTSTLRYSFTYDDLKRLENVTSNGNNEIITKIFKYDVNNKLIKVIEKLDNVETTSIDYDYDNLGSINNEEIKVKDFKTNISYDSISRSSGSHPENMYKEYIDKDNYLTCFFNEDINLRGKNITINGYNRKDSMIKLTTSGIIPHTEISDLAWLAYSIPYSASTYGSIGFWFKPTSVGSQDYVFVAGTPSYLNDYNLIAQLNSSKQIELKYEDTTGKTTIFTTSNSIVENEWNFFGLIWKGKQVYLSLNGIERSTLFSKTISLPTSSLNYFLCHCGYSISEAYPLNCMLTGVIVAKNKPLSIDFMKKYYMQTQEYLISKVIEEDGCSLVNHTVASEIQIDTTIKNQFKIYPLNNHLKSLNGTGPVDYSLRTVGADKDRTFNFNPISKRYSFVADGNILAYKFGGDNVGTIGMNVFLEIRNDKQYILYSYNSSNSIALYVNSSGKLFYEINGTSYNTSLSLNLKTWHFVALSYKSNVINYGSSVDVRVVVDSTEYTMAVSVQSNLTDLITLIGRHKNETTNSYNGYLTETTSYPLYGQVECLCHRAAYCETSTIHNLRKSIKIHNITHHYNELGMLKKKDVKYDNKSILSNVLQYKEGLYSKETPIEISKEIIKTGNATHTRAYAYTKGNVSYITDSVFGSHSYGYNYRGFLTNDDGTAISYDSNGNISSYGSINYTYDSTIKDRLASVNGVGVIYSTSNPLNPETWGSNEYAFEGRRLIQYENGSNVYKYCYDNQGLRTHKINDNQVTNRYFYNVGKLITDYRSPTDRLDFLYDNNGLLYGFINNKTDRYYYVRDILQNILGIVDSNGTIVVKYDYNAFGKLISITGDTTLGNRNPFKWKGYYYDTESEMYYCKSRYYVPAWCRWLNADSCSCLNFEDVNGSNLFVYCNNNPVMGIDPTGCFWDTVFDLLFIGWDIYNLCTNDGYKDWKNWTALGVDIVFAAIPFVTGGGGQVVKLANIADDLSDFSKVTVVGETMNRVKVVSQFVNATDNLYDGFKAYDKLSKLGKGGKVLAEICGKTSNVAWLYGKLRSGYRVVDIGIDSARLARSSSYIAERITIGVWKSRNLWKWIYHLFF